MRTVISLGLVFLAASLSGGTIRAEGIARLLSRPPQLDTLNRQLHGHVLDYTANHGADRRLQSSVLCQRRDLYVYVPACYDGKTPFPIMIYLHGFAQDETGFLELIPHLDALMACGAMPPMVIAAPDGSITGEPAYLANGSFYVNSRAGRFEDHILHEVWPFVRSHFCVRPDRESHILAGASMGGFGAYNLGFKARDQFGVLVGIIPPLNLRYENCYGFYFANYNPHCVSYRNKLKKCAVAGRFYGIIVVRQCTIVKPLYGTEPSAIWSIAAENPIEMLDTFHIKPGEFSMFVGYAGRDEFNLDAQAEHFLDVAAARGLKVHSLALPHGRHNFRTGVQMIPEVGRFLNEVLPRTHRTFVLPQEAIPLPAPAGR